MKILIVDDEQAICDSISRNLKRIGFSVISENQGNKALDVMRREQPDIVLLDLVLGDVDGLDILKQMKIVKPNVIVIVITALKDEASQKSSMQSGADDFLTKPFRAEELRKTIKEKIEDVLLKKNKMERPAILLVDDSMDYRKQIVKFFSHHYEINLSEAHDGEMAVEVIQKNNFDLVILDIKMPGQDGIDVLHEIKDVMPLSKVIVLSGWGDKQIILKAMNLGVYAYISKAEPNIFKELQEKVESVLISQGKLMKHSLK